MKEEKTIEVLLDKLDESPPVILGLNTGELVVVFLFSIGISVFILVIVFFVFLYKWIVMSFPLGVTFGVFLAWRLAKKIGAKKQQIPSQIFWGGVMKNLQLEGINLIFFKIKIPFGFIETTYWDNNSHKDGDE